MKKEIQEKLEDSISLIITFLIDAVTVLCFAIISKLLKVSIEFIYGTDITHLNNNALVIIYTSSKYILVIFFLIFILTHLILEIKKSAKKIYNGN